MSTHRRILAVAIAAFLTLALIELGARVVVRRMRPRPPFGRSEVQRAWVEVSERELAEGKPPQGPIRFDSLLGWTAQPGYVSGDGRMHINARGLRSLHEYPDQPPPGKRRVIVCGESFTLGQEVEDEEAWPARLETLAPGLEVWNYGVSAYGTDQALLRISHEAPRPVEVVIVGLMLENIGRNVNRYRPLWYPGSRPAAKPRFVLRGAELELLPQPFGTRKEFVAAVRSGEVFKRLADHEYWSESYVPAWLEWSTTVRILVGRRAYADREPRRLWSDTTGEPFRVSLALLDAFREVARGLGAERMIVLVLPSKEDFRGLLDHGDHYWSTLLGALEARGIVYLDVSEVLLPEARTGGGVDALYLASHFSPRANDLVAHAVAARMAR